MTEWYRMKNGYSRHNSTELSGLTFDASGSLNESANNFSPITAPVVPRKLDFTRFDEDDDSKKDDSSRTDPHSPPCKRVGALRLFDSPLTPKSVRKFASTPAAHPLRSRLFHSKLDEITGMPCGPSNYFYQPSDEDSAVGSMPAEEPDESSQTNLLPVANMNPFTPDGQALNMKKRALSKSRSIDDSPHQQAKRLRESNISRYNIEFVELEVIGRGQFGRVARCVNKLDGCVYALKRSLRPVGGSVAERIARTEVYAHAVLGKHAHVVRYYSAWAEDDHMIIQNEYCDGGSLQQKLQFGALPEPELLLLLAHIAKGLSYIHSHNLVHMDVKPGNIFICNADSDDLNSDAYNDDDDHHTRNDNEHSLVTTHMYKIGDLGHVTCVSSPTVEEGDCRYLPKEVLQEDFSNLSKADIFAFGLTLFEAGGGGPLPKNGPLWHQIRDGNLPPLPHLSRELNQLLKKMVHPDPLVRPSASALRRHRLLHPASNKTKAQLMRELAAAHMRNELLTRKLHEAARCIKSLTPTVLVNAETASFRTRSGKRLRLRPSTQSRAVTHIPDDDSGALTDSMSVPAPAQRNQHGCKRQGKRH